MIMSGLLGISDPTSGTANASSLQEIHPESDNELWDEKGETTAVTYVNIQRIEKIEDRLSDVETTLQQSRKGMARVGRLEQVPPVSFELPAQAETYSRLEAPRYQSNLRWKYMNPQDSASQPSSEISELGKLKKDLYENPQAILYAISIVIMMGSIFLSNPLLAIAGGILLVVTGLHYAS